MNKKLKFPFCQKPCVLNLNQYVQYVAQKVPEGMRRKDVKSDFFPLFFPIIFLVCYYFFGFIFVCVFIGEPESIV
jgi:hypothetical protein